jgi:WD40 repeat protein
MLPLEVLVHRSTWSSDRQSHPDLRLPMGASSASAPIQKVHILLICHLILLSVSLSVSLGFALYGKEGFVSVYEKCDDKREPYYEIRGYTLEATNFIGGAILPTEDRLILVSHEGRLVSVSIGQHDIPGEHLNNELVAATDLFHGGFHDGPIIASDISYHRSVLATIGTDSTVRIWNYETMKCELVHKFGTEDPLGVAMHPSGFQIIISFKEKVKLYNIYLDKLKLFQENVTKSLKELKFSNSGQYWAAASTINVMVYDTVTFTQLLCFQGHMMMIKRLAWGPGDHYLFSAGSDGNVYGWSLEFDHRIDIIASSNRSMAIQGLAIDGMDTTLVGMNLQRIVGRTSVEWGGGGGGGGGGANAGDGNPSTSLTTTTVDPTGNFIIGTFCALVTSQDGALRLIEWKPSSATGTSSSSSSSAFLSASPYDGSIKNLNNQSRDENTSQSVILSLDDRLSVTVLILSSCKKFLYCGFTDGSIRIYEWPVRVLSPSYLEIAAHSSTVIDLRESPTGHILISTSDDGTIFIHTILKGQLAALSGVGLSTNNPTSSHGSGNGNGDGHSPHTSHDNSYDIYSMITEISSTHHFQYNSDTIQLSHDEMNEQIFEIYEQKKKMDEMLTKFTFELHQNETTYNDEIKKMIEKYNLIINLEKEKYENLQNKMENKLRDVLGMLEKKELEHVRLTAELENRYEHKLADQLDRYDKLGEEMELLKQRCDGLLVAERYEYEKLLNDIKNKSRRYEKKMTLEKKRLYDEKNTDEGAFKEILSQQEEEYEDELRQLIAAAESELKSERENIIKLRTLVQTKNTKIDQLKKKLTELAKSATQRQNILLYERKEKLKLLETIEHYKKNLLEREEALSDKEKTILELRSTTRTLENFRYVLDHRLQQLSSERGPITQHIEGLEQHIRTMYEELVEEFENKKEENLKSSEKDLRLSAFVHEVSILRQDNRVKDIYIATFRRELENVIGSFGHKELEIAVKQLYRKYVKGDKDLKIDLKAGGGGGGGGGNVGGGGGGGGEQNGGMAQMILKDDDDDESEDDHETGGGGGGHQLHTMRTTSGNNNPNSNENHSSTGSALGGYGHGHSHAGGTIVKGKSLKKALIREIESELIENAKEAQRQRQFVERSAENLKHRLESTRAEASRINRTRLNENSHLIFECNELRKEVKNLQRKLEISNQSLLDAQAQNLIATLTKGGGAAGGGGAGGAGGGEWNESFPMSSHHEEREESEPSAGEQVMKSSTMQKSMRDSPFPDPRRAQTGGGGGGGGRGTQSAVDLHLTQPSPGHGLTSHLTQQQSAPKILQTTLSDEDHGGGVGGGDYHDPGAPIPNDYYKGAMTVEQRMLKKKENQIQKLTKEIEALTGQLDEASRERSMQRTELSRLRGLLAKSLSTNTAPTARGGMMDSKTGGPPQSASNRLRGRLLLSVGMDNAVRYVPLRLPSPPFLIRLSLYLSL